MKYEKGKHIQLQGLLNNYHVFTRKKMLIALKWIFYLENYHNIKVFKLILIFCHLAITLTSAININSCPFRMFCIPFGTL